MDLILKDWLKGGSVAGKYLPSKVRWFQARMFRYLTNILGPISSLP
jgi:hypothetical protein